MEAENSVTHMENDPEYKLVGFYWWRKPEYKLASTIYR
jgi:hypothetical protein